LRELAGTPASPDELAENFRTFLDAANHVTRFLRSSRDDRIPDRE
jgi:hypothetical protein